MKLAHIETREERLKALKATKAAQETIIRAHLVSDRPTDTVKAVVMELGYNAAVVAVAELVNSVGDWDERISNRRRAWADSIADAANRDELRAAYIYQPSDIHPEHIDQIAAAMMAYVREEPTEEETEPSAAETVEAITEAVKAEKTRSAWSKGVKAYALELLEKLAEDAEGGYVEHWELTRPDKLEKAMLNGAADWVQYSEGGCALIYDGDIAERLCNASELRKTDNGRKNPNPRESWIQCQSRALYQAAVLIKSCAACVVEG